MANTAPAFPDRASAGTQRGLPALWTASGDVWLGFVHLAISFARAAVARCANPFRTAVSSTDGSGDSLCLNAAPALAYTNMINLTRQGRFP